MSIRERVLLRALVADLGDDAPIPDRSAAAFEQFQSAPLDSGYSHITVADATSFYFYVDHQLLESRIVDATARADTAEAIRAVLAAMSGRGFGIPQNFRPSDALSEVYISWVERRLARAGVPTYRHNDDFRLGSASWGQGIQYLERLASELSSVGLELNGEKSWILTSERYGTNLRLASEIFDDAIPPSFPRVDPYTGEPLEPEQEEEEAEEAGETAETEETMSDEEALAVSERIFEEVATRRLEVERPTGFELRAYRELLNLALGYLRRAGSPAGLEQGPALVAVEPALAQWYAVYLTALASDDDTDATSERVMNVVTRFGGYTTPWVRAWLIEPLLAPAVQITEQAEAWLRQFLHGTAPSVLRVRAAVALALHGLVDIGEVTALFDELPAAALPDVVAALGFLRPATEEPRVKAVVESEHLYRWIFEYSAGHADDGRWT
jgi:hypothetical protein